MSKTIPTPSAPAPAGAPHASVDQTEVHPVLADILKEEEPDTVSWVKG